MKKYPDDLKIGDVLVVSGKTFLDKLIGKLTYRGCGYYSHIGMYITRNGNPYIQEALGNGVVCTDVKEFFDRQSRWVVMRCKQPISESDINNCSTLFYGKPYAFRQIGRDLLAIIGHGWYGRLVYEHLKRDVEGVTCPEWVAKVYECLGVCVKCRKTDGVDILPQYLSPNEFIDSFQFELIDWSHGKL